MPATRTPKITATMLANARKADDAIRRNVARAHASAAEDDATAVRIDAMAEAIAKACPVRPYTVEADEIARLNNLAAEYRRSANEIRAELRAGNVTR